MENYFIEFRFQSKKIRSYLKETIYGINRRFKVGKRKHIPHITLIGPFITTNERRLIADFSRVCSETKVMKFRGEGFGTFNSNRVVYVNIGATDRLNEFRIRLVELLRTYCKLQQQDKRKDIDKFGYHSTLAMNLSQKEFDLIKKHIKNKAPPNFTQIIMRITLLRNSKILREYDFMFRKLLDRRHALNKHILMNSKKRLRQFMAGHYNPDGLIKRSFEKRRETIWDKIKSLFMKNGNR
ncbi:2'-5' RNA ligase family protein [Candidatus Pacearchaeota archaeon]|nr:2'-5' RNA ligase family protein [Candidatus Pacearchaeota archaeon]